MNNAVGEQKKRINVISLENAILVCYLSPPPVRLLNYMAQRVKTDTLDDLSDAVRPPADKPAVIDVSVDPAALYSFRRDSFAHRAK